MSWANISKREVTVSAGSDFPEVPDDLYDAMIADVSEYETRPDPFNEGKDKTDFYITWEVLSDAVPSGTTLRQYITIPEQFLSDGYLNEKSNMYKLMDALGIDMTGKFRVDPNEWQGAEARIMVENKANTQGVTRPRITGVKPAKKKPAAKPAAKGGKRDSEWDDD